MFKNKLKFLKEQSKDKYGSANFYRVILLVIAYFYFVSGLFYYNIPTGADPIPLAHRGFIIFLSIILFIISYFNDWLKRRLETASYLIVYSVLAHLAYITYFYSFQYNLAVALIGSMIIANLFFKGNQVLLYCNVALALFVGLTLLLAEELSISFRLYYFAFYLSSAAFTSIVSYQKFKTRQQLDKLNQEQKILLNNTDTQIWYLKDYDSYGKVNQAHADFLGYEKEEIENKKLADVLSFEEAKICRKGNKKVFEDKKKNKSEEWVKNHRGERRLLSIRKIPKINEQNEVEFVVCSAEDITKKRQGKKN
ncbi:PAS domain-containing protein [Halanaerobium hydrogeniformans]|uniref:PAS sensor protein n=1 Tax=Halanaerobium hydrogeniformans TaxID=656519 RepID=E4RN90_HALHG|nr:PAS domain-containing protein [Halanaerobium hydrogeniformans]ADQ14307.1 PAS sensor protein [Halanaerobium hydrogeniformans]